MTRFELTLLGAIIVALIVMGQGIYSIEKRLPDAVVYIKSTIMTDDDLESAIFEMIVSNKKMWGMTIKNFLKRDMVNSNDYQIQEILAKLVKNKTIIRKFEYVDPDNKLYKGWMYSEGNTVGMGH